jgi:hypothetical protein
MVPSVRNAEAGQLHVLQQAKCINLFHAAEFTNASKQLQDKQPGLHLFELDSLDELLEKPSAKHFPYLKTWTNCWKEPVIIAHSSGSTGEHQLRSMKGISNSTVGFPKQITITNGALSVYDSQRFIPTVPGRRNQDNAMFNFSGGGRFYSPYPPFHVCLLICFLSGQS